jgi:hypothetical protein
MELPWLDQPAAIPGTRPLWTFSLAGPRRAANGQKVGRRTLTDLPAFRGSRDVVEYREGLCFSVYEMNLAGEFRNTGSNGCFSTIRRVAPKEGVVYGQ